MSTRSSSAVVVRARARRGARGFTLIELAVALVGGLLVGIAVVGLSKEATNTFHEDMRAAQAQFSARTAIDRLRSDVSRAGYMSSPNIWGDPQLVSSYRTTTLATTTLLGVQRLAGVRLFVGGSLTHANIGMGFSASPLGTDEVKPYSATNNLNPDAIDITGNMNTVESYTVQTTCGGGGGATRLVLGTENPAAWRLMQTPPATNGPIDTIRRAFIPVAGSSFLVRLQDAQGRVQYLEANDAGVTSACGVLKPSPYVDVTATIPIIKGTGKGNVGGEAGFFSGSTINPVLTVRYKLGQSCGVAAATWCPYTALDPTNDPSRYDLYRVNLDSAGAEAGVADLVAEYAVDLKFAFTVDSTAAAVAPALPTATRAQTTFPFDDGVNNALYGKSFAGDSVNGPQRIRSVRIRLATRTPLPDRSALLTPDMAITPVDYTNLFRYCTDGATPCKNYARVRTSITEVSLNNLSKATYP